MIFMMDNINKVIDIASGVLLFVFSVTISVFLYSKIIGYAKNNFIISDMNNKTELAVDTEVSESMIASRAEMIMTLININDLEIDEIKVNSSTGVNYSIKPDSSGTSSDKDYFMVSGVKKEISTYNFYNIEGNSNAKYSISYNNDVLIYSAI
jgi:hypothetical protein